MIVHHFPRPCPPAGWPNLVIHARGRGVHYTEHQAPLSIKCVLRGREVHEVRGIPYVVDEGTYLLLNHGQPYSSRIGPEQEAETFSVFFQRDFAEQALRSFAEPADRLLDEPDAGGRSVSSNPSILAAPCSASCSKAFGCGATAATLRRPGSRSSSTPCSATC